MGAVVEPNVNKKSKRRRTRWLYRIGVAVVVLLIASAIVHKLAAPVEGHTTHTAAKIVSHHSSQTPISAGQLQSNYFKLTLPSGYHPQSGAQATAGLLYNQTLIKSAAFGSLVVTIAIKNLPDGGLAGDSNYSYRSQQADRYRLTSQPVGNDTVTIANDTQVASLVAFWPHGPYLATISVTSGVDDPATAGNKDELQALQPLLQAWQWQ